jgi:hypothetical protein
MERDLLEDEMNGKQINRGDRVQTKYGEWLTMMMVYENMIYVYEHQNVIHADNIVKVVHS